MNPNISARQEWYRYLDRLGVPKHIPDKQVAKYKAAKRQEKCENGKKRKKERREIMRKKRNEKRGY